MLALGKDGNAYLLNRNNLGGIALPVTQANGEGTNRGTSAVTYRTSQGTYFAFHNDENTIRAYRITADESSYDRIRLEHESERTRLALGHNY